MQSWASWGHRRSCPGACLAPIEAGQRPSQNSVYLGSWWFTTVCMGVRSLHARAWGVLGAEVVSILRCVYTICTRGASHAWGVHAPSASASHVHTRLDLAKPRSRRVCTCSASASHACTSPCVLGASRAYIVCVCVCVCAGGGGRNCPTQLCACSLTV
jgi:hypothetical protein